MAVSCRRLNTAHDAEVRLLARGGPSSESGGGATSGHGAVHHADAGSATHLSLLHDLEVGIERLVRVLDDETVLHGDAGRGSETALLLLGLLAGLSLARRLASALGALAQSGRLLELGRRAVRSATELGGRGTGAHGGLTDGRLLERALSGERRRVLLAGSIVRSLQGGEVLIVRFSVDDEALRLEVEHDHLVEFLGQLKDAAEDNHLVVEDVGGVAAASGRAERALAQLDLLELLATQIELPQIIQLDIIVAHATKNVTLAIVHNGGLGGANARFVGALVTNALPLERVSILLAAVAFVDAGALHEATEDEERLVVDLGETVVVAGLRHITGLL